MIKPSSVCHSHPLTIIGAVHEYNSVLMVPTDRVVYKIGGGKYVGYVSNPVGSHLPIKQLNDIKCHRQYCLHHIISMWI